MDMVDLNREDINGFDVREFYVDLVNELKQKGFNLTGKYCRDWHRDQDKEGATYLATYIRSDRPTITAEEAIEAIKHGDLYVGDRLTGEFILR